MREPVVSKRDTKKTVLKMLHPITGEGYLVITLL